MRNPLPALTAVAALIASAACTVQQTPVPGLSGPSELALSLKMSATPDRILQDGLQSSRIAVTAFDASGSPISVTVHLDVAVNGVAQNFGSLSTNTVVTGPDAKSPAFVTYMPPASTTGNGATVTIFGSIISSNAAATNAQQVQLFVTPATAISGAVPTAVMSISPVAPAQAFGVGKPIFFDGSGSCGGLIVAGACSSTSAITSYAWNFGDGTIASGVSGTKSFAASGNHTITLTVTNDRGLTALASQTIIVTTALAPKAAYTVSPVTIKVANGGNAFFNAAASTADAGHGIVRYDWNFGDNNTGSSTTSSIQHAYGAANVFHSTLTVTDDLGQTNTTAVDVTVVP